MIKNYSLSLESEVVDKAKEIAKGEGATLSGVVRVQLEKYVKSKTASSSGSVQSVSPLI